MFHLAFREETIASVITSSINFNSPIAFDKTWHRWCQVFVAEQRHPSLDGSGSVILNDMHVIAYVEPMQSLTRFSHNIWTLVWCTPERVLLPVWENGTSNYEVEVRIEYVVGRGRWKYMWNLWSDDEGPEKESYYRLPNRCFCGRTQGLLLVGTDI
jgi:hypothetical protein